MTEDKHQGLPVPGYKPQSSDRIALVSSNKETEEGLLRVIDEMMKAEGPQFGAVLGQPSFDRRWLAIARTHFEQGFMALNRAVFQPTRIKLPGDDQ